MMIHILFNLVIMKKNNHIMCILILIMKYLMYMSIFMMKGPHTILVLTVINGKGFMNLLLFNIKHSSLGKIFGLP